MLDLYVNIKNAYFAMESALRIAITNSHQYNTPGFKYSAPVFTTIFENQLTTGTANQNPISLGSSVTLGSVTRDFGQGAIVDGSLLDVAIKGEGFFITADLTQAQAQGAVAHGYTRNGRFRVDGNTHFLVDMFGRAVFGFAIDEAGNTSTQLEPIFVEDSDIGFINGGILVSNFTGAKTDSSQAATPRYRLAMSTFFNKQGLSSTDGATFQETAASGENTGLGFSGRFIGDSEARYGSIFSEKYESSNVDIARINLDLNVINRGTSAVQGVMDDLGKTLSGFIQKL